MKYKYETFEDYFEETENFAMRLERFHEEFDKVPEKKRKNNKSNVVEIAFVDERK